MSNKKITLLTIFAILLSPCFAMAQGGVLEGVEPVIERGREIQDNPPNVEPEYQPKVPLKEDFQRQNFQDKKLYLEQQRQNILQQQQQIREKLKLKKVPQ